NEFLKFQDAEEVSAFDIADAFAQMWETKRYHEILFMIDTCQANTMYSKFYSPNILAVGSSKLDESSYSHHADSDVGVAKVNKGSELTMKDLFDSYDPDKIHSQAGVREDLYDRNTSEVRITDFFGNVQAVEIDEDDGNDDDGRQR
ncbi:hypothetical protein V1517DRAFT_316723, partial [Lipomyces orientalis]